MESSKNQTVDDINRQQGNNIISSNDSDEFRDASTLLASVKGEGLVNLNEGAEILGLRTILGSKR